MTEQPTPQQLGIDPSTTEEALQRILDAITPPAAEPVEPWPFGDGTAENPYTVPPGFTLDTTEEQAAEIIEEGQAQAE